MAELVSWSLARWGGALTDSYLDHLHEGMEWIAKNQKKVSARNDLTAGTGLSVYPIREHYVVFLPVEKEHVIIVAFLRQGRDVAAILSKNGVRFARELKEIAQKMGKSP